MQDWKRHRAAFAALATAPVLWLIAFFLIPLGVVWLYSFGRNVGLTEIDVSGTFANYARALAEYGEAEMLARYQQLYGATMRRADFARQD